VSRDPLPLKPADAWAALALGLEPSVPPDALRARIFASVDRATPYKPFLPSLARCFDLADTALHDLLARMDDPGAWMPGVGDTLAFLDFQPGPALAGHCGITRVRGGARVPLHRHSGREITVVLRGTVVDGEGQHFQPGQVLEMAPGSIHSLRITGDPDALLAVLTSEIEIVTAP
jgi:quercetin dioxygenase-like cupin family protein